MLSLRPLQASKMRPFEKKIGSWFRNSSLISIHIIIELPLLLLSFSKYICLRQNYEFPFILRDLRHIYQCILCQLQTKCETRVWYQDVNLLNVPYEESFHKRQYICFFVHQKMLFLFILLPWLPWLY